MSSYREKTPKVEIMSLMLKIEPKELFEPNLHKHKFWIESEKTFYVNLTRVS